MFDIAALASKNKRVLGLMPHPERALRMQKDAEVSRHLYGKLFFEKIFALTAA